MKNLLLGLIVLLASVATSASAQQPLMYASAISDWKTGPDGVARMNLVGDSTSPTGLATFRLRYPAGVGKDSSKAVVHFHLGTEHILVLKGVLVVGFGDSLVYSRTREYRAPGFVVIPSGRPHYEWTRGETELHVEAVGPTRTIPWPKSGAPRPRANAPAVAADTTPVYPDGLPPWKENPNGSARMNLVGGTPSSPTELVASRSRFLGTPAGDTTRIIYHYHFGTEHITILKGTLW